MASPYERDARTMRPAGRGDGLGSRTPCDIPGWDEAEVLLRDLGADDRVIETVNFSIEDNEVQGRITKLREFAQDNPLVVLGALSALVAGGAVAARKATKTVKRRRAAARTATARKSSTKKSAAPKRKPAAKKARSSTKRTLIEPHPGDKRYIRRDAKGRIQESVDVGKSLSADKRKKSKTKTKPGFGDQGDR